MKTLTKTILVVFFLWAMVCGLWANSYAAIPHLINYQGRLTDSSGIPLNGSYSLTFRIYDAENAGNLLWQETHSGALIQKGIFSVLLGSVTSLDDLPFNKQYYLEIKVGTEVMSPRQIIASVAYAIAGVPSGLIVIWFGPINNIPKGWALCDGTNGTPDLRDRFIVGARQDEGGVAKTNLIGTLTKTGGSTSITIDNLPSHTHSAGALSTNTTGLHIHGLPVTSDIEFAGGLPGGGGGEPLSTSSAGEHSHTISGSTGTTGSGVSYTQPYHALAYIMKL